MSHKFWACISGGSCAASIAAAATHLLFALQVVSVVISIIAGIKALRSKN